MADKDSQILKLIYSSDTAEVKEAKPTFTSSFASEMSIFCDELDAQIEALLRM